MHPLNSTLNTIEHDYTTLGHKATIGIVNSHAGMELGMALDGSGTISGDGSGEVGRRRNANKFRKAIFGSTPITGLDR